MTSSNIKSFMPNNFHINPWVISKNANEIVNTCIHKIYKQVPPNSKYDHRKPKISSVRPENKAPIRTLKNQTFQLQQPMKIRPQFPMYASKKQSRSKVNQNHLMDILKTSYKHNKQISRKMASNAVSVEPPRKLLKSPNLRIYSTRRYGSSASSSRSNIFKRFDDKRRQRQQHHTHHHMRNLHSADFDATFSKYLMPTRNQQVKSNLGSLPDAMKVSSSIQNDLMCIDGAIRERISVNEHISRKKAKRRHGSDHEDYVPSWKHPPALNKFQSNYLTHMMDDDQQEEDNRPTKRKQKKRLQQHKEYEKYNVGPLMPIRRLDGPRDELLRRQPECENLDVQEKHRRFRMKKLGLMEESPKTSPKFRIKGGGERKPEKLIPRKIKPLLAINRQEPKCNDYCFSKASPLTTHLEAFRKSLDPQTRHHRILNHFPVVKKLYDALSSEANETKHPPAAAAIYEAVKKSQQEKSYISPKTSDAKSGEDTTLSASESESALNNARLHGPLALAAQFTLRSGNTAGSYSGYRFNRSSFFPSSKY